MSHSNIEFVYYEPTTNKGASAYFGYGKLGKVFEDKREGGHYFAEIIEYKPFSNDVPFYDKDGTARETGPSYNPQNSARMISAEVLDSLCLDGGIILNFTADAHLIKVLGEELIATEVVGILELVKNAYDANASLCRVRIESIPNLPEDKSNSSFGSYKGPIVIIEDDGIGMNRNTIEYGWMRPASTIKTRVKDQLKAEKLKAIQDNNFGAYKTLVGELKKYHNGRLPLGEKGVGRFATHRLGRSVIITSKTADIDFEYKLEIDWDKFTSANPIDLSSIGFSLTRQFPTRDYGKRNSGTRLVIYGGREEYQLTESTIHDINRSLIKLKSPKPTSQEFNVIFECPQVTDLSETNISKEFEPVFSIDILVDENGIADYEFKFEPPHSVPLPSEKYNKKLDLRKTDETDSQYWKIRGSDTKRTPKCGSFFLHVDIWYRSSPWIDGPNAKNFTDYLDNFGGISIYRDGLNIFPAEWGAEVDWLKLSKRHIKKGINLSYYNMLGNIELEQSNNLNIIDKTDRQGLLNNEAFRDIATLVRNILFEVEVEFTGKRKRYTDLTSGIIRDPRKLDVVSREGAKLIEHIIERYDIVEDSNNILKDFGPPDLRRDHLLNLGASLKNMQKSLTAMQEVQDLLTEQAGYGLAIGVAVHEVAKITSNFYNGIVQMIQKGADEKKLLELKDASSSLKNELLRLGPMRAVRNAPSIEFDIKKSIRYCTSLYESKLKDKNVSFIVEGHDTFHIFTRYATINQVLSNLIANSLYWLSDTRIKEKKICIKIDKAGRKLIFADNGPDIDESIRPYLFEPGYSLKVPPSGLGLYICKYYMRTMKGNIYEANQNERLDSLSGAQFVLDFSRVPEKEGTNA